MIILALDLSTYTGWAHGEPNDTSAIRFGTVQMRGDGDTARVFANYGCWLRDFLSSGATDLVAYEAPLNLAAMATSGISNATALVMLNGLAAATEAIARGCYGKRTIKCTPQQWRKAVLGVGRPDNPKLVSKTWARSLGWMVKNDHEADALGVHWWACGQRRLV